MKATSSGAAPARYSILLVDDVPHGMVARKTMLTELGYAVSTAESGEEALASIRAEPNGFHVVVTDYKMPGMDGLELIQRLRELRPAMKIVMLSGLADIMGMTEQSSGADVVLSKSAGEIGHLARAIKHLLARKPAASQRKAASFMVKSS